MLDALRGHGTGATARDLALWIVRRNFLLFGRDLDSRPSERAMDPRYIVGPLEESAWADLLALQRGLTRTTLRRRVAAGAGCTVVRVNARIVYFRWHTFHSLDLDFLPLRFAPEPGDLLIFDVYAHPCFRGRGLHAAVSRADLPRAWDHGIRRVLALIPSWNRVSCIVAARAGGMRPIGSLTYAPLSGTHRLSSTGRIEIASGSSFRITGLAPASR